MNAGRPPYREGKSLLSLPSGPPPPPPPSLFLAPAYRTPTLPASVWLRCTSCRWGPNPVPEGRFVEPKNSISGTNWGPTSASETLSVLWVRLDRCGRSGLASLRCHCTLLAAGPHLCQINRLRNQGGYQTFHTFGCTVLVNTARRMNLRVI